MNDLLTAPTVAGKYLAPLFMYRMVCATGPNLNVKYSTMTILIIVDDNQFSNGHDG